MFIHRALYIWSRGLSGIPAVWWWGEGFELLQCFGRDPDPYAKLILNAEILCLSRWRCGANRESPGSACHRRDPGRGRQGPLIDTPVRRMGVLRRIGHVSGGEGRLSRLTLRATATVPGMSEQAAPGAGPVNAGGGGTANHPGLVEVVQGCEDGETGTSVPARGVNACRKAGWLSRPWSRSSRFRASRRRRAPRCWARLTARASTARLRCGICYPMIAGASVTWLTPQRTEQLTWPSPCTNASARLSITDNQRLLRPAMMEAFLEFMAVSKSKFSRWSPSIFGRRPIPAKKYLDRVLAMIEDPEVDAEI